MLNSLANYFWGSTVNDEQNTLEEHLGSEHLETQQVEDWVVVRTAGETISSDQLVEVENREASDQPLVNEQFPNEEVPTEAGTNVLQQRNIPNHVFIHPNLVSARQLVKSIHLAQRIQHNKAQKNISTGKCESENKVREFHSHGKGYNRRNKRICPSGFRSSRFSQRF